MPKSEKQKPVLALNRERTQQEIIELITATRAENNILWMMLLKLALEKSPKRAKFILASITKNDKSISKLLGSL